jgi:cytochrome c oxidase subunit 2
MVENKFAKLALFGIFLILSGMIYQRFYRPPELSPIEASGKVVEISMRVKENEWRWDPSVIKVEAGDRVILKIFNEDSYDHGFALEVFGINKRLFPKRETVVDFVASKEGEFTFYCSVPCGEGHYRQTGTFIVTPQTLENASPDGGQD